MCNNHLSAPTTIITHARSSSNNQILNLDIESTRIIIDHAIIKAYEIKHEKIIVNPFQAQYPQLIDVFPFINYKGKQQRGKWIEGYISLK